MSFFKLRPRSLVAGALLALGLAAWYVHSRPATAWDTTAVRRTHIETSVTAMGTLQPRRYVDVGAQVSGQVNRLHVQPGAQVGKGQLLVEIDPSVQQATVDASRAALAGLRAQLADQQAQYRLAAHQHARQLQMARDEATRLEDVQTAEATLGSAAAKIDNLRAQIDQTQATLKADEARLGYTRIFAPMAGTVVSLEAREGQTLNATYQTPNILRIADLSAMTVWTEVSEADVRRVKPGMPVYFTTLGGDARRWQGRVRQVLPAPPVAEAKAAAAGQAATSKVVLYTVLFDVDNLDAELMPQMTAQVSFVTASAQNVLTVPMPALKPVPGQPDRYTARVLRSDGQVESRTVRLGVKTRLTAEVLDGLQEGEQLVTGERVAASGLSRFQW
ncbi:membrane fusion protein, macrolide-specific efflux system [Rhodoferax sp. OV413]|uniref:efflux RND transporter periplasmic adaptor subunit n=1 Tax=Rhodoferax sp. OV413 TaxID=1855285 RepID=UPI00089000C4|nr:efflux RND transporter periplasmic adaptor subunit [Rhodoferax sp. OV413]SDN94402.1 membrane fusion protein, macrolide-specific efflux system [Rhodoferax sp. OV413]